MDAIVRLWLENLQAIVSKDANRDSLYELLRMASPSLSHDDIVNESIRNKAMKALNLRIHPDKHPNGDTTKLFQDVQAFYTRCCTCMNLKNNTTRKQKVSTNGSAKSDFPQDFHVQDNWPHLDIQNLEPQTAPTNDIQLTAWTTALCFNARGTIAHGQKTELHYPMAQCMKYATVVDACEEINGGSKHLTSVEEVKRELMENGPVVSTSFVLTQAFLSAGEYSHSLLHSRVGTTHELLLVGWKLTAFGEVWLAKPIQKDIKEPIRIAFDQFSVNDLCVAPTISCENTPWQNEEWMGWTTMDLSIGPSQLQELASCFDSGLVKAATSGAKFVIRDKIKKAHSRRYRLQEIEWDEEKNQWKMRVDRII